MEKYRSQRALFSCAFSGGRGIGIASFGEFNLPGMASRLSLKAVGGYEREEAVHVERLSFGLVVVRLGGRLVVVSLAGYR